VLNEDFSKDEKRLKNRNGAPATELNASDIADKTAERSYESDHGTCILFDREAG